MSELPRLRRHTNGRVAVSLIPDWWTVTSGGPGSCVLADIDVSGDGWSELFVAEFPDAEHHADGVDDNGNDTVASQWEVNYLRDVDGILTAWTNGVEIEGVFYDVEDGMLEYLESDALKLIAAIAGHRQCAERAEREATP